MTDQNNGGVDFDKLRESIRETVGQTRERVQSLQENPEEVKKTLRQKAKRAKQWAAEAGFTDPATLAVVGGMLATAYYARGNAKTTREIALTLDFLHNDYLARIENSKKALEEAMAYGLDYKHFPGVGVITSHVPGVSIESALKADYGVETSEALQAIGAKLA